MSDRTDPVPEQPRGVQDAPDTAVRDLLTAIRAMVDVPLAASGDDRAEQANVDLMRTRAAMLRGVLDATLTICTDLDIPARVIRQSTAETPVTYAVYVPPGKDTSDATQAHAGESTRTCRNGRPHAHHTGCAGITTAEHRQAAPPPGPAAELPRWTYRAERTEAPRPDYAYSFGTRPAADGPAERLATDIAARVRVEHTYAGLITVWVWPRREDEHYRQPVPEHAERWLFPAGEPSQPISCANPTCLRRETPVAAIKAGWENDSCGGWLCPQCDADAADRAEFLARYDADEAAGGAR